jgi:raffinose/stachyose/melibiose transport system substrate-binding protein
MKFNRETILNGIGFSMLIACFLYAGFKVLNRAVQESQGNTITIRFAHWQLEAGVKDAFDAIAAEYIKLHPHIKIDQILIPERTYAPWLTTRLAGQNPPDLVAISTLTGMTDERLATYFMPLSAEVEKPNPYNAGTSLEGVRWIDTFVNGLANAPGLSSLFDYYAVPNAVVSIRLYYNKDLYQKVTGKTTPPRSYEDLKEVFQAVDAYNKANKTSLVTIAGSKYNAPILMDNLSSSQTQRVMLKLDKHKTLRKPPSPILAFLEGDLNVDDPAILSSLGLNRDLGQQMPQGFMSLAREDATFSFVQQKSLMIATGSWDVTSLRQESPFEIEVIPIPKPSKDNPEFGPYLLGPQAETESGGTLNLGLSRDSEHPEEALDFLKFVTSQRSNSTFSEKSNWLPVVVGVPVPESVKAFRAITDGYPAGFTLSKAGGPEVTRIYENAFYRLVHPTGGVDDFMEYFKPLFKKALLSDYNLQAKNLLRNISRQDSTLSALQQSGRLGSEKDQLKAIHLQTVQNNIETDYYRTRYAVWLYQQKKKKEN